MDVNNEITLSDLVASKLVLDAASDIAEDDCECAREELSMWVKHNDIYEPAISMSLEKSLSPGTYKVIWSERDGMYQFRPFKTNTDELIRFENNNITPIMDEIKAFWDKADLYKKYGLAHKRGLLLQGQPGCGKTALIALLTKDLVDQGGLIFMATNRREFNIMMDALPTILRKIEPDRQVITIIEDIDKLIAEGGGNDADILEFLDGKNSIEHHLCIMTSNDTESLSPALCRPSRIDMNYVIEVPDFDTRRKYLASKDIKEELLDEYATKTEGFSFADLKEVFVGTQILGKDIDSVINKILNPAEATDYLHEHGSIGLE